MRKIILSLCVVLLACSSHKEKKETATVMNKSSDKVIIYQLMTRLFGNKATVNKQYGTIEENGVGKFEDINNVALKAIRDLGATHIWCTGVIEHAVLTDYTKYGIPLDDADVVKGRAGSPYAIKDYYDVDPDLAVDVPHRMEEFEALVSRTHEAGLKVIIDFVPNHVARAYKSDAKPEGVRDLGEQDDTSQAFSPGNNFYYLPGQSFRVPSGYNPLGDYTFPTKDGKFEETPAKVTGNDQFTASPGINEWFETVKLNYGVDILGGRKSYFDPVPDTWIKMRDILIFWAKKSVDGFRCDMAEMVPVEFWGWVIPQVREVNANIIFIAEIYNPDQYRNYIEAGRFDYLYDKVLLYDTLRLLINGQLGTKDIGEIQKRLSGINSNMLHFLENHDEQRIASKFFAGSPWKALPGMVISATIDKGPVMIYFGQEVGEPAYGAEGFQGDDGRTTIFDYWGVAEHQKWMNNGRFDGEMLSEEQKQLRQFYGRLLNIAATNTSITRGEYIDITEFNQRQSNFNEKVHAFLRYYQSEKVLIVTSFNDQEQNVKVEIPHEAAIEIGIEAQARHAVKDILGNEGKLEIENLILNLPVKPYASHIFQIQ
ncbi:alpha-amylase family protein [Fulvivirgaceae bacterium PWU20]|uniref:Alpha-amylase family protein n=2 Tax=Chryseosolibacter indicus TaxID=2782351 RepID=A0ABS5VL33_9BACT|nr:alpha-amylase family protein [Chryseosolibacter indicus]